MGYFLLDDYKSNESLHKVKLKRLSRADWWMKNEMNLNLE